MTGSEVNNALQEGGHCSDVSTFRNPVVWWQRGVTRFVQVPHCRSSTHPKREDIPAIGTALVVVTLVLDRKMDTSLFGECEGNLHVLHILSIDLQTCVRSGHLRLGLRRTKETHVVRWDVA